MSVFVTFCHHQINFNDKVSCLVAIFTEKSLFFALAQALTKRECTQTNNVQQPKIIFNLTHK